MQKEIAGPMPCVECRAKVYWGRPPGATDRNFPAAIRDSASGRMHRCSFSRRPVTVG